MATQELNDWSSGCLDCMDNTDICLTTCLAGPCITFGFNVADLRDVSYSAPCCMYALACCLGCPCLVAARTRTEIRTKYGLKSGPLSDHLMHFPCCTFLALCQETRQLKKMMQPTWPAPAPAPTLQPSNSRPNIASRGSVSSRGASEANTGSAPNTGPIANASLPPGGSSGARASAGPGSQRPPSGLGASTSRASTSSGVKVLSGAAGPSSSKGGAPGSGHLASRPPSGPKAARTPSAPINGSTSGPAPGAADTGPTSSDQQQAAQAPAGQAAAAQVAATTSQQTAQAVGAGR